jgi:hypothetical protein
MSRRLQWEGKKQRRRNTRWGLLRARGLNLSPAHPTLKVSLAITAVGSPGLGITAVTITQCVQLHSQLL